MVDAVKPLRGIPYLPAGYSDPTNVVEALRAAKAVLEEEGRWCKGDELDAAPQDTDSNATAGPFCGSWQACAVGAVGVVTTGTYLVPNSVGGYSWYIYSSPADSPWRTLYLDAVNALDRATLMATEKHPSEYDTSDELEYEYEEDGSFESVVELNDHDDTTLSDVLHIFDVAIADAEKAGEPNGSNTGS